MEMTDKLTEVSTTIKENIDQYYTDVYDTGSIKEQTVVGQEVKLNEDTGTIDTETASLSNRVYTLSVANPNGLVFSMGIDGVDKTFKVGPFGTSAEAYADLETQLQDWLSMQYTVEYISGTNYNISRLDGAVISKTNPTLVRTIELNDFNSVAVIDVIIDGTTITLDGPTHGGNAGDALDYLITQLPADTYYTYRNAAFLDIARIDIAIPVITKTQYDKYSYAVNYSYSDTPSSGQFLDYTDTTVEGVDYRYNATSVGRAFRGDEIVRNLGGYSQNMAHLVPLSNTDTRTTEAGIEMIPKYDNKLTIVNKNSSCTATRALLKIGTTTLATSTFSGDVALFDYVLTDGVTYRIVLDNNGSSYTAKYTSSGAADKEFDFGTIKFNSVIIYNIDSINLEYVGPNSLYNTSMEFYKSSGGFDTSRNSTATNLYFNQTHKLKINKTDLSAMTFDSNNHYTDPGTFPDSGFGYSLSTDNNRADIIVTTTTEITITNTLSANTYFIPFKIYPNKIIVKTVSASGSSDGVYENREQYCTTLYSGTTAKIDDLIFKTNADNYGSITKLGKQGATFTWTTNTSNKLTYTCT